MCGARCELAVENNRRREQREGTRTALLGEGLSVALLDDIDCNTLEEAQVARGVSMSC